MECATARRWVIRPGARRWWALIMGAMLSGPGATNAGEPRPAPACDQPPDEHPPDPRCGETLDGREPPPPSAGAVPRAALWVPRAASRALFWPVVNASDVYEGYQLANWMRAILTTDDGLLGVRPLLHYSSGFLSSAGLRLFDRRLPGAGSELVLRLESGGPSILLGELVASGPTRWGLTLRLLANRRNDRLFAGIGSDSADELAARGAGLARYGSDLLLGELRWARRVAGPLQVSLHGDAQRRWYRADGVNGGPSIATLYAATPAACAAAGRGDGCVDPAQVPGFDQGLKIAHGGAGLGADLRRRGRDSSGVGTWVDATYAHGLGGDPSRHVLLSAEAVLSIGGTDRLLLLRGRAAAVWALGQAPIPFEELVAPAGIAGMRGFPDGRFHGESGLVGTAEYRWYIAHNLDATLFSDLGTVAGPSFAGLGQARWFPSFGAGIRLVRIVGPYWEADTDAGIQVVYAPDGGWRFLVAVAPF